MANARECLLGIDIGTSACKLAVFDRDGGVLAHATEKYDTYYPERGWAEQDPEQWWSAVCRALRRIFEGGNVDAGQILAAGIDGQSWSAVPLGGGGEVLCRTPIWMDSRSGDICLQLRERIGEKAIFDVCGNPIMPTYTSPKVLWYKENRREIYDKTQAILQSNGYIAYKLTGVLSQDKSQGYGWHCYDIARSDWSRELCREMGIKESLLLPVVKCDQVIGTVTMTAAGECGLLAGTPVVAGGLDAACGALGAGVIADGQTQEQGGQAGGMSICENTPGADMRLILSNHVVDGRWLLQGGSVGGGSALKWFDREFGSGNFAELDALAEQVKPGCDGMVFLPYMAGERSPIWNPDAEGVYYGVDFSKTKGHFARATLEGVAYSLRNNLDVAKSAGAQVNEMISVGGAANSKLWTQIKADVTGCSIATGASDYAATLGAALLAGVGVGLFKNYDEAVANTVRVKRIYSPNPDCRAAYDRSYKIYLKLYEDLKELMSGRTI